MVGASKILTVSYGTFSCTLEGFEEPFSTMKAIAEYFRDLAADDRYFGATPPTPDAEMLHRIAEREIQRRVEAKISEHGIVLRAADEPAAAPAVAPAAASPLESPLVEAPLAPAAGIAATDTPVAAFPAEAVATPSAAPAVAAVAAGAGVMMADHDSDDVAAKLSRIRAVIAAAQAAKTAAAAAPAGPEMIFEEDDETLPEQAAAFEDPSFEEEDAVEADTAAVADTDATDLRAAEIETTDVDDDFGFGLDLDDLPVARHFEPADTPAMAAPAAEAEEEEPAHAEIDLAGEELAEEVAGEPLAAAGRREEADGDADAAPAGGVEEIADEDYAALAVATLAGAGEVVAAEDARAFDDSEDDGEDDAALDTLDLADWRVVESAETAIDEAFEEIAAAEDADEAAAWDESFGEDEPMDRGAPEAAAADADVSAGEASEDDTEDDAGEEDAALAAKRPGFFERARARVIRIRRTAAAEPLAEEEGADLDEAQVGDEAVLEATSAAAEEAEDARHAAIFAALTEETADDAAFGEDTPDATEDALAAEAEAEAAAPRDEDAADHDALIASIDAAIGETGLDAQSEEELLRELAEAARDARRDAHEGRTILEDHAGDGDSSVERLMEEAKSKLEGDESRRRFSAIAHLKAAVAATVADRKLKSTDVVPQDGAAPVEDIDRYRDDLSKAVRPRRPMAEGASATRRPILEERPAPLILVSEQRVDTPDDHVKPTAVIRPRRIAAANLSVADDDRETEDQAPLSPEEAKSFAEFADRLGATNLGELLEAAAAYTATVEGLPHFSRPQILKKVANLSDEDEFSREDGLRSFGMLLRQGKIQKISRGQFTITETSRFMAQARRAAR